MIDTNLKSEIVKTMRVSCDGGEGALGHPRVWLQINPVTKDIVCDYCGKRFVLETCNHNSTS